MIAAIPTTYRGRRYRSRLEARYAAFFDLVGWHADYEPIDLDGWIPDFCIREKRDILVEIKPTWKFLPDVAEKVVMASRGTGYSLLLLGLSVNGLDTLDNPRSWGDYPEDGLLIGWAYETREWWDSMAEMDGPPVPSEWSNARSARWLLHNDCQAEGTPWGRLPPRSTSRIGFSTGMIGDYTDWISGRNDKGSAGECVRDEVTSLWTEAGNIVQWKAPR